MLRHFVFSDGCLSCALHQPGDFCHLAPSLTPEFDQLGNLVVLPSHVDLLMEGVAPPGIFIVCSGRVKLSVLAKDGRTVILRVAGERQILGLSAVVSGRPSPLQATTIESCQIKSVDRESFLRYLERNPHASLKVAQLLSHEIGVAFRDVHGLLLARSSTEKLARLLLSWVANEPQNRDLRVAAAFTHEEMAQMIGSSRETVTRLLSDLKRRELIRREGSTLIIPSRHALRAIAA